MDNFEIGARLLFSLARKRKWGESHTSYENLFKQFQSAALGKTVMKQAKNTAEELVRQGLIMKKPTGYGLRVSLNPNRAFEIKKRIKEKLGFDL